MRFPWLQVDADFIAAHAGDLGAHLGISRREAMGLALDLWTWALARASDDAPPDGLVTGTGPVPDRLLSGSVGWTGPVETFTAALLACGLAVRVDDGYRLTGFVRYKATWEKNRRRAGGKPERNRSGTGEEPARKTQTQTQTQTGETTPPPRDPSAASGLGDYIAAEMRTSDPGWAWDLAKEQTLRGLLGKGAPLEILRRLRIARARDRFPLFTSLQDLVRHWDVYAAPPPSFRSQDSPRPALAVPEANTCVGCGARGQGGEVGEPAVWLGYECGCLPAFSAAQQDDGLHFTKAAEWAEQRRQEAA